MSDPQSAPGEVSPHAVAEAALACPCVASLAADGPGQLATHLPGERVVGVADRNGLWEVGVVLRLDDRPLPELAEEVRRAVAPAVAGSAVHVVITDVVLPGEQPGPTSDHEPA